MIYKIFINNKIYETNIKIDAFTIYKEAGMDVNKVLISKKSSEEFYRVLRYNL